MTGRLRRGAEQSRRIRRGRIARATASLSCSFDSVLRPAAEWQPSSEMHRDAARAGVRTNRSAARTSVQRKQKKVERNRLRGGQTVGLLASDGIKNESAVSNFF
ncbi:hypothetical protein [Burkholderia anthina]|uniref:hypothetical protein n=1 Tax=Burkholderia anthina TaxID=179879 RepID=UPI00293148BE|nr:hypothetical protein [Burkholderia anthina]